MERARDKVVEVLTSTAVKIAGKYQLASAHTSASALAEMMRMVQTNPAVAASLQEAHEEDVLTRMFASLRERSKTASAPELARLQEAVAHCGVQRNWRSFPSVHLRDSLG